MMRQFVDPHGREWDVVVGRESWGSLYALFVPRSGSAEGIRQTLLDAVSLERANREVSELSSDGVARLFEESEPKDVS